MPTHHCVSTLYFGNRPVAAATPPRQPSEGWNSYGGDPGGSRYSSARQISRENVAQLKVAWTFHTGAWQLDTKLVRKAAFESTPILFDNKLFLTSPYDKVFALDPATGEKIWEFDPHVDLSRNYSEVTSRGVSAWRDLNDATVQQRFADQGQDVPPREQQTPEALAAQQKAEIEKWWPILKAANIKGE